MHHPAIKLLEELLAGNEITLDGQPYVLCQQTGMLKEIHYGGIPLVKIGDYPGPDDFVGPPERMLMSPIMPLPLDTFIRKAMEEQKTSKKE